jgi:signal transduction histidine kinase
MMAALGGLVAGISHEINNPIGVGVTAASYLQQQSQDIERLYHEERMTRSELEQYLKTAITSSDMILGNLHRAAELIQSFKQVAVDRTSGDRRLFNLKDYIDGTLLSLHPQLKKTGHTVITRCPGDLNLESFPGAFSQIISNLILNSLIHGFEEKAQGEIRVDVTVEENMLVMRYSDNGRGMPPQEVSRIFEPFYTTKRGQGGSGLGLHIVYNLITQQLNGIIECESLPEAGTTFIIQIPINQEGNYA